MKRQVILIIDDGETKRIFIRPLHEPPPVARRRLVLRSRVAERCRACGEWRAECGCEEEKEK